MAKAIMIQGTTSNAGKSLLTGALCRILRQDGYRVAPFKSQNMALNSGVTADGLEMGRAQVMQAECAGIEPDVRMNPILLKPNSDTGSQVILNGEVIGNMKAAEYFARKQELVPTVLGAYESLAAEYDIIVLEGAGSPAEINLKEQDIVNMGMARMAGAPVLLVGDINPGGVFASLAGTVQLLEPEEREMLKGVIINKFRGDVDILRPGLTMLEEIIHKPVLGVVPWLDVDVDDEDSLSDRLLVRGKGPALVDIAVVRLPRLSNFTDFAALDAVEGVRVRYVGGPEELGEPDLLILPGTKNTMGDLKWLRESGLEPKIMAYAHRGGAVFGICGGYQMLGTLLRDPEGLEHGGTMSGLGLLEMETVFTPQKRRRLVQGTFGRVTGMFQELTGQPLEGYEIHMGRSRAEVGEPLCVLEEPEGQAAYDGCCNGNVYGCYLHGVFDRPEVSGAIIRALLRAKGLEDAIKPVDPAVYKQMQYDKLAASVRKSLDMGRIYAIIEEGISWKRNFPNL